MVLGMKQKNKKASSVDVDYFVTVQDIKPWPPSDSLNTVQFVLLQWKNGDLNYGSLSSIAGDSHIEFNESFALPVTLRKKKARDTFSKNYLEFNLYESRKGKVEKDQILGTAAINLAEHGVIREIFAINVVLICKKGLKITSQPVLNVTVQPFDKNSFIPSPNYSLPKEAFDGVEFVSSVKKDENEDESDDDYDDDDAGSSHSSWTVGSALGTSKGSPFRVKEASNGDSKGLPSSQDAKVVNGLESNSENRREKKDKKLLEEKIDFWKDNLFNKYPQDQTATKKNILRSESTLNRTATKKKTLRSESTLTVSRRPSGTSSKLKHMNSVQLPHFSVTAEGFHDNEKEKEVEKVKDYDTDNAATGHKQNYEKDGQKKHYDTDNAASGHKKKQTLRTTSKSKHMESKWNTLSVQLPFVSIMAKGFYGDSQNTDKEREVEKVKGYETDSAAIGHKKHYDTDTAATGNKQKDVFSDVKTEWRSKIKHLEEELTEAAVLEAALYSVVPEHECSLTKVHAPARRLSRFYLHFRKGGISHSKKASAARAAISGLILVSKSCGNDVSRLTFWLSNSIMLRAIVNQAPEETPESNEQATKGKGGFKKTLKWSKSSAAKEETNARIQELANWENPRSFISALEKFEAWLFSRIVGLVWWQALAPHMQPAARKASGRRSISKKSKSSSGDQEHGNFSIDLWKKAFKDVSQRLCPIRAGKRKCGCLPVLARLVTEQLVNQLDVAMLNAILRDSTEGMPTDPMSDPISDSRVLPIPASKSSFGAGVQLKNAIGNWSRSLTDLFGTEDNGSPDDRRGKESAPTFKPFRLLNSLSDLMMLPTEMLADTVIRKEICPMFGPLLIKRVFINFVPDEFSPKPIPRSLLDALDYEDAKEVSVESAAGYPCIATPAVYLPPPSDSIEGLIAQAGSLAYHLGSSITDITYTSDEELDELNSPFNSVLINSSRVHPSAAAKVKWTPEGSRKVVRYQLLQEIWKDSRDQNILP